MKNSFLFVLSVTSVAFCDLRGVRFEGVSLSRYERASLAGDSVNQEHPTTENQAFSQADVSVKASPGGGTRGLIVFRLHQDWSKYYAEGPDPFALREVQYGGSLFSDRLRFSAGDFRAHYSALTVEAPAPELPFEPEVFAARRREAMDEWFLDSNQVPLQGLDVAFAGEMAPSLEMEIRATGARLRSVDDESVLGWRFQTGETEKWLEAGSAKVRLWKSLDLGMTRVRVFDLIGASRAGNNAFALANQESPVLARYEDETVNSPGFRFDASPFLRGTRFAFAVSGEYAFSGFSARRDTVETNPDSASIQTKIPVTRKLADSRDNAFRGTLRAGFGESRDPFSIALDAAYLRTGADYVNDVAQSPTFIGRRILDSQSPVGGASAGYATLDALYNHEYHVSPITSLNTSEYWGNASGTVYNGTNNWVRAPFFKNSYTPVIASKSERDSLRGAMDPNVQLLFPFGAATPNRAGFTAKAAAGFLAGAIKFEAVLARLHEIKGEELDSLQRLPSDFGSVGGGVEIDAGALMNLSKPLRLSCGLVKDSENRPAFASGGITVAGAQYATTFLNVGGYARLFPRLALSAGYQSIKANPIRGYALQGQARTPSFADQAQSQWTLEAEVNLAAGATVLAQVGRLDFSEIEPGPIAAVTHWNRIDTGISLRIDF